MLKCIIWPMIIMVLLEWILSAVLWCCLKKLRNRENPKKKITSVLFDQENGILSINDIIVILIAIAFLSPIVSLISEERMYAIAAVCMIICATYVIKKKVLSSIIKK